MKPPEKIAVNRQPKASVQGAAIVLIFASEDAPLVVEIRGGSPV
jgi:hypothetical protein